MVLDISDIIDRVLVLDEVPGWLQKTQRYLWIMSSWWF